MIASNWEIHTPAQKVKRRVEGGVKVPQPYLVNIYNKEMGASKVFSKYKKNLKSGVKLFSIVFGDFNKTTLTYNKKKFILREDQKKVCTFV